MSAEANEQTSNQSQSDVRQYEIIRNLQINSKVNTRYEAKDLEEGKKVYLNILVKSDDFPELEPGEKYMVPITTVNPNWGPQLKSETWEKDKDLFVKLSGTPTDSGTTDSNDTENQEKTNEQEIKEKGNSNASNSSTEKAEILKFEVLSVTRVTDKNHSYSIKLENEGRITNLLVVRVPDFPTLKKGFQYEIPITKETSAGFEIRDETWISNKNKFVETEPVNQVLEKSTQTQLPKDKIDRQDQSPAGIITIPNSSTKLTHDVEDFGFNEFGLPPIEVMKQQLVRLNWLKKNLVTRSDYQKIRNGEFLKKSGWRKIAQGFGLSFGDITSEIKEIEGDIVAVVTVKVIAPSGRYCIGKGQAARSEPGKAHPNINIGKKKDEKVATMSTHDLLATAETRARNRGISDLVAFGEVSAEELY